MGRGSASPKAIETTHSGLRFRSRLEARWAIFFEEAGVSYEYEPEGFECESRLTGSDKPIWYLPDFWLPDLGVWVEVKGLLDDFGARRLADVAASLCDPTPSSGGCAGSKLLLAGALTTSRTPILTQFHLHKGELLAMHPPLAYLELGALQSDYCPTLLASNFYTPVGDDLEGWVDIDFIKTLPGLSARRGVSPMDDNYPPLVKARQARFEHGERA